LDFSSHENFEPTINSKPSWLLLKDHDEYERSADDVAITDEKPNSSVTKRTMDQIASSNGSRGKAKRSAKTSKGWYKAVLKAIAKRGSKTAREGKTKSTNKKRSSSEGKQSGIADEIAELLLEKQANFYPPQLASESTAPPSAMATYMS
jgi:bifunctional non-homologous end joining protein LigD